MKRISAFVHTLVTLLAAMMLFSVLPAQAAVEGDNPHGPLSLECSACHTTEGWHVLREKPDFDHARTAFPLIGRHTDVACRACHTTLEFAKAGIQCADCHLDIHRGQFADRCADCHTPARWANEPEMIRRHQQTRFPLTGVHADVECQACHANGQYVGLSTECVSCHRQALEGTQNPDHAQAGFSKQCGQCHNQTTADWQNATFDHAQTGFALSGGHTRAACNDCHSTGYRNTSTACYPCHQSDYAGASNPDHAGGHFDQNCQTCHSFAAWQPATFDHNLAQFPLTGAHVTVECAQCHIGRQFTGTSTECFGCHSANFNTTTNPPHVAESFPHGCTECHNTSAWSPATFDHNRSEFPLTGAHITVNCAECHIGGQFANTASDCWSCHQSNFNGTTNPNHLAAQIHHGCADCHSTTAWQPANFDHSSTAFPLTGAHSAVTCVLCHVNGQFTGTATQCYACHQTDFQNTTQPNHAAAQFPQSCADCHTTVAWTPSSFNHANTGFALNGAHTSVACGQCHVNGQYTNTPTQCYACHQSAFDGVQDPNHVTGQFDHNCLICHSTTAWQPATFDHNNTTFPLTGAHVTAACARCHSNGQFHGTPTDCWSCHQSDFASATDPNHVTAQFPHTCQTCHNTTGWEPSTFNHANTNFALTGAHTSVTCAQCHASGQYAGTPTECYACHQNDFNGVQNPNHVTAQFSHTCTQCHTTAAWQPASFDHATTSFPLTGAHTTATCVQCHVNGQFSGTPTACYACHQAAFEGVQDPNHVTGQFSHICTDCHSTAAWQPATFNHNGTAFPLTGAHVSVACSQCHLNGQYHGLPADCWSCHQADYNGTSDPNHATAQFPHACAECHTTANWNATFDHDGPYFPIYSGRHRTVWDQCSDCHTNPNNFAIFSCIDCHEHNQADTDGHHDEVTGYVYQSSACYTCHPRGVADDRLRQQALPRGKAR